MKTGSSEPLFQILFHVPAVALEPVADRLIGLSPSGVQWEDDKSPCKLITYVYGEKNASNLIARMEEHLSAILEHFPGEPFGPVEQIRIDSEEWAHAWKKFFKPTRVSELLIVKPTWESYLPGEGEIVIDIDPEMAFGTGTHESTRLCLQAIESLHKSNRIQHGCRLLDIGTGTGILTIAAIRFGVQQATAIDNDPIAVETARKNAELNGIAQHCIFSEESIDELKGEFDAIVANINSDTLCALAIAVANHQKPGGILILGGITNERAQSVKTAYEAVGYGNFQQEILNEWTLFIATLDKEKR